MLTVIRLLSVGLILLPVVGLAQNLAPNPDFDTDVDGWEILDDPADVLLAWNPDNAGGGALGSGSLSLSGADSANPFGNYARAYSVDPIAVPSPSATMEISASIKVPLGQPLSNDADIRVGLFSEPDCLSGFVGLWVSSGFLEVGAQGEWAAVDLVSNIPQNVTCALLELNTQTPTEDPLPLALFDLVTLHFSSMLFADGFESGDTNEWSSTAF